MADPSKVSSDSQSQFDNQFGIKFIEKKSSEIAK
jgi:hypothetical protein